MFLEEKPARRKGFWSGAVALSEPSLKKGLVKGNPKPNPKSKIDAAKRPFSYHKSMEGEVQLPQKDMKLGTLSQLNAVQHKITKAFSPDQTGHFSPQLLECKQYEQRAISKSAWPLKVDQSGCFAGGCVAEDICLPPASKHHALK